jgi:tRNA(Ile2) C34 agmatinyltransferase TiaS
MRARDLGGKTVMDATRCPNCKKRLMAMTDAKGRTDLRCLKCDKVDPKNAAAKPAQAARA